MIYNVRSHQVIVCRYCHPSQTGATNINQQNNGLRLTSRQTLMNPIYVTTLQLNKLLQDVMQDM